jgi:hypothetical protein
VILAKDIDCKALHPRCCLCSLVLMLLSGLFSAGCCTAGLLSFAGRPPCQSALRQSCCECLFVFRVPPIVSCNCLDTGYGLSDDGLLFGKMFQSIYFVIYICGWHCISRLFTVICRLVAWQLAGASLRGTLKIGRPLAKKRSPGRLLQASLFFISG